MNRVLPAAPPVMGFTGASPVRAMQAMSGGVNRIAATPYGPRPMTYPTPPVTPPPRPSASQFNPLTNVGEFANPKTMVTFSPTGPQFTANAQNDPTAQAIAPGPNASAAVGYGPQVSSNPLTNRLPTAPVSAPAPAPLPTSAADRVAMAAGVQRSSAPIAMAPGANASAATGYGGSMPQQPMSASGRVAPSPAPATNPAQQRTAPTGFLAYNAADPNRALKMMRGY